MDTDTERQRVPRAPGGTLRGTRLSLVMGGRQAGLKGGNVQGERNGGPVSVKIFSVTLDKGHRNIPNSRRLKQPARRRHCLREEGA